MSQSVVLQKLQIALTHFQARRFAEAEALCREALSIDPGSADAIGMLGLIAYQAGNPPAAFELLKKAVALQPQHAKFHHDLGLVLSALGRSEQAAKAFEEAVRIRPDYADAWNNLGTVLKQLKRLRDALAAFRRAIALRPDFVEAHYNCGNVLKELRFFDDAIAAYRRAIELRPDFAQALSNLGAVLKDVGEVEQSVGVTRKALEIKPDLVAASNLLCTLHYSDHSTPESLYREHENWDLVFGRQFARDIRKHQNDPSPGRVIRVGYVSPDLSRHPVGRCLVPVLSNHDHTSFQIIAYSDAPSPDDVTARLRACTDVWRETAHLRDDQLAELIRQDGVDILIDLASHTNGNRLAVFARKPAPVQVTWLGMPTTTGLSAMDYRLSDPYLDPPDIATERYSERTVRLPHCYWPYDRPSLTATINAPPSIVNGFITFGCLNNCCKMSDATLQLWARVLLAVPDSRLLLRAASGHAASRIQNAFGRAGVDPSRLDFVDHQPHEQYLATYNRIDIGLDTVAYGGHVTSLDSLWMGVPVVTLAGDVPVRRAGLSFCANLSLPNLVATTAGDFVRIASELAADRAALSQYRATLRVRLEASPIMDGPTYARDLEKVFRDLWSQWCAQRHHA